MDNNKTVGIVNYSYLLQEITAFFNLSLQEIKKKYADYPLCLMDYFEAGIEEKSIEIRFDQEGITITCEINNDSKCQFVYLFPDKNEFAEKFVLFLKDTYDYDFIKNRWIASGFYITVKKIDRLSSEICLMFYY